MKNILTLLTIVLLSINTAYAISPEVQARIDKTGVSSEEIKDVLRRAYIEYAVKLESVEQLTSKHLDVYEELVGKAKAKEEAADKQYEATQKQNEIDAAVLKRNAKIHKGKQYICSSGNDSWLLYFNDFSITFGEVNFTKTFIGYTQPNRRQNLNDILIVDRIKSTVTYHGNTSTCKPR